MGKRASGWLLTSQSVGAIWGLAALAAVGGALAPGAPTGVGAFDVVLRAGFALFCTTLASRARRWAWVLAGLMALVGAYSQVWGFLALFALALAIFGGRRSNGPVLGALIGASLSQVLLRLALSPGTGVSAALAGLALIVLFAGGLRRPQHASLRWLNRGAVGVGILAVLATVLAGVAILRARSPAELGLTEAKAGVSAAESDDPSAALTDLNDSAGQLRRAHADLAQWWAAPAHLVPIVSQNERAVGTLTLRGTQIAAAAVAVVHSTQSSTQTTRAKASAGSIELSTLTKAAPAVDTSLSTVSRARHALAGLNSFWLLPPVTSRVGQLSAKVDLLDTDETKLAQAVKVLPELLGYDGPQRYLVMVQDPSELRGGGGLIGDRAILTTDDGHLSLGSLAAVGPPPAGAPALTVSKTTQQWAESEGLDIAQFPQDDSFSPDFPTDARLFESSSTQLGTPAVDGVISVDPTVLQAILTLTGPVSVAGWPVPLSSSNVLPILLHEQYVDLQGNARMAFLASATSTIFDKLTHAALPGPLTLARSFAPAVASKHLLAYSNDSASEHSLQVIGVGGSMPAVNGDFLEVVTQNAETDKIDYFLRRSFHYQVTYDPTSGEVHSTLTVTLTNTAPTSGQPAYVVGPTAGSSIPAGTAYDLVTVYSPLSFVSGKEGGKPLLLGSDVVEGRNAYSGFVEVPAGSSTTVTLKLAGTITGGARYNLDLADQPAVAPDKVSVSVKPTASWQATGTSGMVLGDGEATYSASIDSDHDLSVGFS